MVKKIMSPATERSILALLINNEELLLDFTQYEVLDKHFIVLANKYIFNAILYLYNKNTKPTPTVIMEVIANKKARKEIESMGGEEYIEEITEIEVDKSNLKLLTDKLKQAYTRNKIYNICKDTAKEMISENSEVLNQQELVSVIEEKVSDVNSEMATTDQVRTIGEVLHDRLMQRANNPSDIAGLTTGFDTYDTMTNGAQASDLIVVVARPKMGKSALLTNWACNICIKEKIPGIYIDTEMTTEEHEDRLVSMLSGVPHSEILNGMFAKDTAYGKGDKKIAKVEKAIQLIKEAPYYHYYLPDFNKEKVNNIVKKHKFKDELELLFFDYIKLPSSNLNALGGMKEYQAIGYFTSTLKDIAGSFQIPVFTAAQESRAGDGENDKSGVNVAGSDRILQFASKLMFLYKKSEKQQVEESTDKGNRLLKIIYQRNGGCDLAPINIQFDNEILKMREA